jgi:hypothetical protein
MATTYEKIATTTLGSAAANITFSSISSAYTDIVLVVNAIGVSSSTYVALQLNGDTGSNYSYTYLRGNGTAAASGRATSQVRTFIGATSVALPDTYPALSIAHFFSYAGSTYKTILSEASNDQNGSGETTRTVSLWQSTSAINEIKIIGYNANLATGTIATIYGILKA